MCVCVCVCVCIRLLILSKGVSTKEKISGMLFGRNKGPGNNLSNNIIYIYNRDSRGNNSGRQCCRIDSSGYYSIRVETMAYWSSVCVFTCRPEAVIRHRDE